MWGHNGGVKLYVSITETLKQRCGEPRNIAPATTCQICSRLVWSGLRSEIFLQIQSEKSIAMSVRL